MQQQTTMTEILDQVGWLDRVIVNRITGCVVDGHMRVLLAMERGEQIPIEYADLTEEEEAFMLLMFDRVTEMAGTDREKTRELLALAAPFLHARAGDLKEVKAMLDRVAHSIPPALADEPDDEVLPTHDVAIPPAEIKMVQLFLTVATHPQFNEWVTALAAHYGCNNVTDTVWQVVKDAYEELSYANRG